MASDADVSLTPRPLYGADGLKLPDCYSDPPELRDDFNREFGTFPLFHFWGPATSIASTEWIARAARAVDERLAPTLELVYLPHLGRLIDHLQERGCRVIVLSEYGVVPVERPVSPNRILREAGFLALKLDLGLEYLDPARCRAFAVSDHQIAHVYVQDRAVQDDVRKLFETTPGVAEVLGEEGKRQHGLHHERSGELVLLAEPDSWFTYYFWLDDARAPDYARTVDIHRKPSFDPCELLVDPALRFPRLKAGATLARKALGFRYVMQLTPLDARLVKGSHGVVRGTPGDTPVFLTSEPKLLDGDALEAVQVRDRILDHVFRD